MDDEQEILTQEEIQEEKERLDDLEFKISLMREVQEEKESDGEN